MFLSNPQIGTYYRTKEDIYTETMAWKVPAIHEEKIQNRHSRFDTGDEMTQTGWPEKQTEVKDFIWGTGREALYQMTRAEYKTELYKLAIKNLIRRIKEYFLPKRNMYRNRFEFFWTKETETETPEAFWRRLIGNEKECNLETLTGEELRISKFMTVITDKKLRDKLQ